MLKYYYDTNDSRSLKQFLYAVAVKDFDSKNVPVNVPVNPTELAVLDHLSAKPTATYDDIALAIGKTRKTVSRAIASLKQQGLLRRQGSDKSGSWQAMTIFEQIR